ncbi:Haloacetate dehalogenase H-1 [bacterium HR26]|nr:Haloacetate dehalogenase H-1 [bacterium HR26]
MAHTQRISINGAELAFTVQGEGEPVILIHGGLAEAFLPLRTRPELIEHNRLIDYARRGYNDSMLSTPVDIPGHAADCRVLLDRLGIVQAHIVGHSFGGNVALQLALDAPETVASLALLEPALPSVLLSSPEFGGAMAQVIQLYQAGDRAAALDIFLSAACGPDYRAALDSALPPGAFERATVDLDTLLQVDLPALQAWTFTREDAARIRQPVLSVVGAASGPLFWAIDDQVQSLLPQVETFTLPKATHLLMVMNAADMASRLARFFARHPIRVAL